MNKINVTLAATLAACSVAFADATVQTFEDLNNDSQGKWVPDSTTASGWSTAPAVPSSEDASDYPAIAEAGADISAPANGFGVIVADPDPDHTDSTKVLSLNGGKATVTMPNSDITTSDLLVKVVHSSLDQLSLGDFANPAPRLAIAVDNAGKFNACTNGTAFFKLSDTRYEEGTWVRVTTLISTNCCRIALNGQLACNGAWLPLASPSTERSLTVQSSSCIDDVVVKTENSNVYDKYAAVTTGGNDALTGTSPQVPTNYATKYGVTDVNPTVRAAYEKGVAPGVTFAISNGSFDGSNVTLTFPGDWPADAYVVKYGSSPTELTETATISSEMSGGNNTVVVDGNMSGRTVLYYQVTRTM